MTPICFVVDKYFVPYAVALGYDILKNETDFEINIFIQDESFDIDEIKKYPSNIKYHVNRFKVPNLPMYTQNWTKSVYGRLYIQNYFDCDKIIFMDADMARIGEISFLDKIDLGDAPLAAVSDCRYVDKLRNYEKVGINSQRYFNAGLMIINTKKWREIDFENKLIEYRNKYSNLIEYPSQDFLNYIFQNNWLELSPKYNFMYIYANLGLKDVIKPSIIHYTTTPKPWYWSDFDLSNSSQKYFNDILINAGFDKNLEPLKKFTKKKNYNLKKNIEIIINKLGIKSKRYLKSKNAWDKQLYYFKEYYNDENIKNNIFDLKLEWGNYNPIKIYDGRDYRCKFEIDV